jgi:hypothetical protein
VKKIRRRRHRATLQNYKATWTSLLTNEKAKSTFTRRLLRPDCPPIVQVQTTVDSINLSADFRPRGCKFKSHWHHQAFFTITVSTITTVTGGIEHYKNSLLFTIHFKVRNRVVLIRPKKKYVCLRSPDPPYFSTKS